MRKLASACDSFGGSAWRLKSALVPSVSRQKVFCVGLNKTGTTSLERLFIDLGYRVGSQRLGENLLDRAYCSGEWKPIVRFCRTAEFFQDVPFSAPETFKVCDAHFPGSKFILTVRPSADEWWHSLVRFHSKLVRSYGAPSRESGVPTTADVKRVKYVRPGWVLDTIKCVWGTDEDDLYNYDQLTRRYLKHIEDVRTHFRERPDDLLEIDLSRDDSWTKFCSFMDLPEAFGSGFPHLNRSRP